MELIKLAEHARNPNYYNRDRDILVALAWNAIKKTLSEIGREDLFEYIRSVYVGEKYVTITTQKPVVNTEIKLINKTLLENINRALNPYTPLLMIGIRTK